mmetsp:Transcript_2310/g.5267  ORF Transcript_2310/g.5267 Transcript_2310/m.5267 type:complete len:95 (-) Transcript_2310:399-683(-)
MHQSRYVKEGSHVRCIFFLGGIARSVDQRSMSYDKSLVVSSNDGTDTPHYIDKNNRQTCAWKLHRKHHLLDIILLGRPADGNASVYDRLLGGSF